MVCQFLGHATWKTILKSQCPSIYYIKSLYRRLPSVAFSIGAGAGDFAGRDSELLDVGHQRAFGEGGETSLVSSFGLIGSGPRDLL